jgi:argininosuccinate synthase
MAHRSMESITLDREGRASQGQPDAAGFVKLNALRLRLGAMVGRKGGTL